MASYEDARYFAAAWGLAYFALIFAAVLIYALRPSKRQDFDEAARIPLRED